MAEAETTQLEMLLLNCLMQNIPDAVYFKDRNSKFIAVNGAKANRHGFQNPGDLLGKSDFDLWEKSHAEKAFNDERQIMESGQPFVNIEEKLTWPDGSITWVSSTKMPIVTEHGQIIGTFGLSRDITERMQLMEALQQREADLQTRNHQMRMELKRAQTIQRELMPGTDYEEGNIRIGYRQLAMADVAGDFVAYTRLSPSGYGFFLGDVCGHGVSAALYTILLKHLTQQFFAQHGRKPAAFVGELNKSLIRLMPSSFITGIAGAIEELPNHTKSRLVMAAAAHPNPLLFSRATGEVRELDLKSNAAIGIIKDLDAAEMEFEFEPGDRLILFTDGLVEGSSAEENAANLEQLVELTKDVAKLELGPALNKIIDNAPARTNPEVLNDDITVFCIERKGAA